MYIRNAVHCQGKNRLRDPRNDESFPEVIKIIISRVVSPEESWCLTAKHKSLLCLSGTGMCQVSHHTASRCKVAP